MDHPRVSALIWLALAAALVSVAAVVHGLADDGQAFEDQPAEVQRIYRSLYGDDAVTVWERDHNREIADAPAPDACARPWDGATVAWDGRHLGQEAQWVQDLFAREWQPRGVDPAARWAWEYECLHPRPAPTPTPTPTATIIKDPTPAAPSTRQSISRPAPTPTPVPKFDWHSHAGGVLHRHPVAGVRCVVNGQHEHHSPPCPTPTPTPEPTPDTFCMTWPDGGRYTPMHSHDWMDPVIHGKRHGHVCGIHPHPQQARR